VMAQADDAVCRQGREPDVPSKVRQYGCHNVTELGIPFPEFGDVFSSIGTVFVGGGDHREPHRPSLLPERCGSPCSPHPIGLWHGRQEILYSGNRASR
jgi:hypothetical protein